jgi:hypothetical protein
VAKMGMKRSPPHPTSMLPQAIDRARRLYRAAHESWAPMDAVAETWESSVKSSSLFQAISTLKQFGLLEEKDTQRGEDVIREFRLTQTALDILHHEEGSPEWLSAVRDAAQTPTLHRELLAKYNGKLPPEDAILRSYLLRQREGGTFHPEQVDSFIRQLRETLEFAKLPEDDKMTRSGNAAPKEAAKTGDFIQWTCNGVDQFPTPRRVKGVSDDGAWVFVDGESTGIPMAQTTTTQPPSGSFQAAPSAPPANPFHAGMPGANAAQSRAQGFPTISLQVGDFQEFPLYTPSGKGALSVPAQMTKKAFELLKRQIENSLSVIEATAVVADEQDGG